MAHYTITAPVTGTDDKTRYPRVGVLFENHNRETGEVYFTIKLDFPVGVTDLIAFPPRPRDENDSLRRRSLSHEAGAALPPRPEARTCGALAGSANKARIARMIMYFDDTRPGVCYATAWRFFI